MEPIFHSSEESISTTFYIHHRPGVSAHSSAWVYRVFSRTDRLIYVGSTGVSVHSRLFDHYVQRRPWFPLAHRVEVEEFDSVEAARSAERDAIVNEEPLGNVVCTGRRYVDDELMDLVEELLPHYWPDRITAARPDGMVMASWKTNDPIGRRGAWWL